jgi:hypothetical protein
MANWRNKINLSEHLTDNNNDEQVLICVNVIIPQLENILIKERDLAKINEYFLNDLEELIDDFKCIQESISNKTKEENSNCSNWCDEFNDYLEQLYDMGDTMIEKKDFWNDEKFLWIG